MISACVEVLWISEEEIGAQPDGMMQAIEQGDDEQVANAGATVRCSIQTDL